jgi:hypothetical protein
MEAVVLSVLPDADVTHLHPGRAALQHLGSGWTGVERWCKNFCAAPETILTVGRPIDILIIHVDCSIAWHFHIPMDCPPAQPTALQLRERIWVEWLAGAPVQIPILLVTPSRASDAWMLVALAPDYWPRGVPAVDIECDDDIDAELRRRHFARMRGERTKKYAERYPEAVSRLAARIPVLRTRCPEAAIFLETLASSVSAHGRLGSTPAD